MKATTFPLSGVFEADSEYKNDYTVIGVPLTLYFLLVYSVYMSVWLHVCAQVCGWCLWGSEEGNRSSKLELQAVVSRQVGAGNRTRALWKSSQCA